MNLILATPLELRLLLLFVLGTVLGAAVNLAVDRMRYHTPRLSPWNDWLDRRRGLAGNQAPGRDQRRRKGKAGAVAPRTAADLLPVFGWLRLRREVAQHGRGFWLRPMLVELLLGLLLAWLYWWEVGHLGTVPFLGDQIEPSQISLTAIHLQYLRHALLLVLMLAATLIDLDEWFIPDVITVPGTLLGVALSLLPASLLTAVTLGNFPEPTYLHAASPHPWPQQLAAGTGQGLAVALGCWWLWCFALMPRILRMRRGWRIGLAIFWRRFAGSRLTWWIAAMGLVGSAILAGLWYADIAAWPALASSLIGMATGLILVWVVRIVGTLILRREAMGFGDVTLLGMIGAMLGWQPVLMVFFIGPFFGLVPALLQLLLRREHQLELPYGPYLCAGALTVLTCWASLWEWGETLFGLGWLVPAVLAVCAPLLVVLLLLLQVVKRLFGR